MKRYVVWSLLLMNGMYADTGWCKNVPNWLCWTKQAQRSIEIHEKEEADATVPSLENILKMKDEAFVLSEFIENEFRQACKDDQEANTQEEQILSDRRKALDIQCAQSGNKAICDEFVAVSASLQQLLQYRHGSSPAGGNILNSRAEWRAHLKHHIQEMQEAYKAIERIRINAHEERVILEKQDDDIKAKCPTEAKNCTKVFMFDIIDKISKNRKHEAEEIVAQKQRMIAAWREIDILLNSLNSRTDIESFNARYARAKAAQSVVALVAKTGEVKVVTVQVDAQAPVQAPVSTPAQVETQAAESIAQPREEQVVSNVSVPNVPVEIKSQEAAAPVQQEIQAPKDEKTA